MHATSHTAHDHTAPCRHFGVCGGCLTQHVPYAEQLAQKQRRLTHLLQQRLGSDTPLVQPFLTATGPDTWPTGFRQKAAFVFGAAPDGGGLVIGHFARGSRDVVPIVECPVHAARANRIAFSLTAALTRAGVPAAGPRLSGVLRYLVVRVSADETEAVATLVVTRNDRALRTPIRAFLDGPEQPTGFHVNVHSGNDALVLGAETLKIAGHAHIRERALGMPFLISPTAFFQTNVGAAGVLLKEVSAGAVGSSDSPITESPRPRVLDLYAGAGLFSIPLAVRGCRVTAVEENAAATRDAADNARLNRVRDRNLRVITARVEDTVGRLSRQSFDAVILDPPRQGCSPRVLEAVFDRLAASRTIYVSCNPQALADELPQMIGAGHRIARVQPVDMFPHTDHIETVVTLER